MRIPLMLGLLMFVINAASAAEKPIPQDSAKTEKRERELLEWNRKTVQGAYDRIGKKDPRWDGPAREAMELAAKMFTGVIDPVVTVDDVVKPARAAIDAGCDDPMVVYLYQRSATWKKDQGDEGVKKQNEAAAKALLASGYAPLRRAVPLVRVANTLLSAKNPTEAVKKEAEGDYATALGLIAESVKSDEWGEFAEERWIIQIFEVFRGFKKLGLTPEVAYEKVDAQLAKIPELAALRLEVRGKFWLDYGWEARTKAFAPQVPAAAFEVFEKRVLIAKAAFEESWKLRPGNADTATHLIDIDKSIGGDRPTMELWFDRAMKADGNQRSACWAKLDWLDPKWHGNDEDMIAFGRACRDTKNWRAGITLLVGEAHLRHTTMIPPIEKMKYWAKPEIWADIQPVFDEYLKHYPNDNVARSRYAVYCFYAGRYPEATAQFDILGDKLVQWSDFPYTPLESMKQMRQIAAAAVKGGKRVLTPMQPSTP